MNAKIGNLSSIITSVVLTFDVLARFPYSDQIDPSNSISAASFCHNICFYLSFVTNVCTLELVGRAGWSNAVIGDKYSGRGSPALGADLSAP